MNVVDSSAWLEYFADGPNAGIFEPAIKTSSELIVPSITLYEVYNKARQKRDAKEALEYIATMWEGRIVELDGEIAIRAADVRHETKLPMADSIILATARMYGATLWTQDADFEGLPGVEYVAREDE